jgi:hypothetical protein
MSDDDELRRLMEASDPAVTPANALPTATELAILERIVRTPVRRRRRWPVWTAVAVPLAAMLVAVFVIVMAPVHLAEVYAVTPRPLSWKHTSQTLAQIVSESQERLRRDGGPTAPERASNSVGWYLDLDNPGSSQQRVAISPEITRMRWNADGSGSELIVAGRPYWTDGDSAKVPSTDAPAPGTIISRMTFTPGQFTSPIGTPPGDSVDDMQRFLVATGLQSDANGGDVINIIDLAFSSWTLTDSQHAALLDLLLHAKQVNVDGTSTDRLGRAVIGISGDQAEYPGFRATLLISAHTGRIIGVEKIRTTPLDGVPRGAVTSYTLWDTERQ